MEIVKYGFKSFELNSRLAPMSPLDVWELKSNWFLIWSYAPSTFNLIPLIVWLVSTAIFFKISLESKEAPIPKPIFLFSHFVHNPNFLSSTWKLALTATLSLSLAVKVLLANRDSGVFLLVPKLYLNPKTVPS